jgi:3-hydroxyisobutyrate dehydrogenase
MTNPRSSMQIGFIGLGNIGRPIATTLAEAGTALAVFDAAGTAERAPAGATVAISVEEVARRSDIVLLSLPTSEAVLEVTRTIVAGEERRASTVVDLSTTGIDAGRELASILHDAGIDYLEAPISGGAKGAEAGTLAVMASGRLEVWERVAPILEPISTNRFLVGREPGQAQAMKLLNNFLLATAMAATSEALVFGERQGLDPELMLKVLNASSGQSAAASRNFSQMLAGTKPLTSQAALMGKDIALYLAGAQGSNTTRGVAEAVGGVWSAFAEAEPETDFSEVLRFVRGLSE